MNVLQNGLEKLNIDYSDKQLEQIYTFYHMLVEKNKVMNLTRITDETEFYVKHVLDSLLLSRVLRINKQSVIDVGTGAGFPGLPLKIFFPEISIVFLDSVRKKLSFIHEVSEALDLANVSTVHGRAEDKGHDDILREKFDISVSRAVADLSILSELCIPFVKKEGYFCAYKSYESDEEIKNAEQAITVLSASTATIFQIQIPYTDINRKIVTVKKKSNTHKLYPRKPGVINKRPIGSI